MTKFFTANITYIFFIYGLAFFAMGLATALEMGRATQLRFQPSLRWLAAFGLIHGGHEWVEMLQLLHKVAITPAIEAGRVITLGLSFVCMLAFGTNLLNTLDRPVLRPLTASLLMIGLWLAGVIVLYSWRLPVAEWLRASDAWTRYSLGVSGAIITCWALILQGHQFIRQGWPQFGRDLIWAGVAFVLYGAIGQLFAGRSVLPPTMIINKELFLQLFGFPVQLFRAVMASIMAVAIIRALRIFEVESRQRLDQAQAQALETERHLREETTALNRQLQERKALLAELLRKTVTAQEEERKRIARELHDETAQVFTALALGLSGLEETLSRDPELARQQIAHLQVLSTRALEDLRQFVADLRPPQLDELGLVPALHWLAGELHARQPEVDVHLQISKPRRRLNPEIETILFRIAQEALANVSRHAKAHQVDIRLTFAPDEVHLAVDDDGVGFLPDQMLGSDNHSSAGRTQWGLLGIQERVALVNGQFNITSSPGQGTHLDIRIPVASQETTDYEPYQTATG